MIKPVCRDLWCCVTFHSKVLYCNRVVMCRHHCRVLFCPVLRQTTLHRTIWSCGAVNTFQCRRVFFLLLALYSLPLENWKSLGQNPPSCAYCDWTKLCEESKNAPGRPSQGTLAVHNYQTVSARASRFFNTRCGHEDLSPGLCDICNLRKPLHKTAEIIIFITLNCKHLAH